ncbi:MAG TPA: RtcB family protein, partial [Candidatus Atribacteria bacterium]|nr:RtcB family protein [Candidatus Atribacteria bacterium]
MPRILKIRDALWEVPRSERSDMLVPVRIYGTEKIVNAIEEGAIVQAMNVAALPGIQRSSIMLPDAHHGYGFPIGGVAAFDVEDGVISPGGVGFDINCGVRLIRTDLRYSEVRNRLGDLADALFKNVPAGLGSESHIRLSDADFDDVMVEGVRWALENEYAWDRDLEHIEEYGAMPGANPDRVSPRARKRGRWELGTLGSGNHFLEVQRVSTIFDERVAKRFGLFEDQLVVMIHTGSRGFGHQIASDYIRVMESAGKKYGIRLPDRQLAAAPFTSDEAQDYFAAMKAAVNFAFTNRQVITHFLRRSFEAVFGSDAEDLGMDIVYDVAHNIAKLEEHGIDGSTKKLVVHRKGATRAFPAGRRELPSTYADVGHPVLIPGSMGTASYVLVGTDLALDETFGSICHGAGRVLSRTQARRAHPGEDVLKRLEAQGKAVRAVSMKVLAEEAPDAYKDV